MLFSLFGKRINYTWALTAVLILAAMCRAGILMVLNDGGLYSSDYLAYWTMASGIYDDTGLIDPYHNYAFMSAGYPILLGSAFLIFGKSLAVVYMINIILGVITTWLIISICQKVFEGFLPGLAAGILWAVYIEPIVYINYVAKENLSMPLILLVIYCSVEILRQRSLALYGSVAGLACGALAIVGPSGVAVASAFLYAVASSGTSPYKVAKCGVAFVLCAGLLLTPWLNRNHSVLGATILNTNGGFNLYIGNNSKATGYFTSIVDTDLGSSWQGLRRELGEVGIDRLCRDEAIDYIARHPIATLELFTKKILVFWTPPYHFGLAGENAEIGELVARKIWLVQWIIFIGLALITIFKKERWQQKCIIVVVLGIISYTAIHGVFYVDSRYQLPGMAMVAILSGGGVLVVVKAVRTHLSLPRRRQDDMRAHIIKRLEPSLWDIATTIVRQCGLAGEI
jgi:Dolichyl-phosphate-mannose-protein mannosyltransferase